MYHVTSSAKGHSMQSLLEKPTTIRSAYLYHTHMHMALCMYACSCMPTILSPSSGLSPLAHMPQRMYASVPRIARLGLIHTMPSDIRTPFLVNVWVRGMYVRVHACVCACHKGQIESLRLSTCKCMCKCICVSTYAHIQ